MRYYIAEGLLPPPAGSGPRAHYTQDHLDRLQVIGLLKQRYLPLREIRRSLDGMTDEDIAATAAAARHATVTQPAAPHDAALPAQAARTRDRRTGRHVAPESSAADYIAGVLGTTALPQPASPPPPEQRSWKRVPITDDAELLVDEATWHRRREQIESLVAWARRILREP